MELEAEVDPVMESEADPVLQKDSAYTNVTSGAIFIWIVTIGS